MTGALKACETDPLAYSYTRLTEAQAQGILASPLFRQAMLFIAITTDNTPLALDILELGPFTIPSEDLWILHERSRGWSSDDKIKKIPNVVWASVIRHGLATPTFGLVIEAVLSDDSAGSIAMLSAIWEVNPELMRPSGSVDLCESSIEGDRGLDINYRTVTDSDEEVPWQGDPIFHSERLYAFHLAPISRRLTALHAAAFRGNAVAVKYLLERGAKVDSQDGLGQTAKYIANRDGHRAVVEVIDAHERGFA
ncbi:hypothetical protein TrVGV298_010812 [Trichoderma virens]|nr:hypothetical protein TrVGV298_010812 [Trichoderma virens]